MPAGICRAMAAALAASALVLAGAATGCDSGERRAKAFLDAYTAAVQAQDLDRLYCLLAGASRLEPGAAETDAAGQRDEFDLWAFSRYEAYLVGRDEGGVELTEDGIALVKAFGLGKGTYYAVERVDSGDGMTVVRTEIRFGYGGVNYADFSPGTTFYLAAAPPGRIAAVKVPYRPREVSRTVLDRIELDWTLVDAEATAACPGGLDLLRVETVDDSIRTADVTWRF